MSSPQKTKKLQKKTVYASPFSLITQLIDSYVSLETDKEVKYRDWRDKLYASRLISLAVLFEDAMENFLDNMSSSESNFFVNEIKKIVLKNMEKVVPNGIMPVLDRMPNTNLLEEITVSLIENARQNKLNLYGAVQREDIDIEIKIIASHILIKSLMAFFGYTEGSFKPI